MQVKLLKVFFVLSLMAIPMMVIYGSFTGYSNLSSVDFSTKISFGNIGFPASLCDKNLVEST
jgi:vacuolar-type H+-ATPase subunit I/STV1